MKMKTNKFKSIDLWKFCLYFSRVGEKWYKFTTKKEIEMIDYLYTIDAAIFLAKQCYKYNKEVLNKVIEDLQKELFPNNEPDDIVSVSYRWKLEFYTANNDYFDVETGISCSTAEVQFSVNKQIPFYRNIHSVVRFPYSNIGSLLDAYKKSKTNKNKLEIAKQCLSFYKQWNGNTCHTGFLQGRDPLWHLRPKHIDKT